MSDEHKTPVEKVLDLVVYGPAGLAVTAVQEFPNLVEKGRHKVDGQVHTARLVGQFAVQMGRRQLESVFSGLRPGTREPAPAAGSAPPAQPAAQPAQPAPPAAQPAQRVAQPAQPAPSAAQPAPPAAQPAQRVAQPAVAAPASGASNPEPGRSDDVPTTAAVPWAAPRPASDNGVLASDALGIPGYDSLSASQVVQRLGGLSSLELEVIRDHELAHRHRQTILNRVDQLLAAEPGGV